MWNFRWCRNLFSWFHFESRWLAENMMKQGFSKELADWLGSNLRRIDTTTEEMDWIFNVDGAYDMFHSYRYWISFSLTNPDADLQMSPVCWGSKRYLVHLPSGSAIKYIVYKENMFEWSVSVFMVYDITFQYLRILLIWWWLFRMQENRLLVSVGATAKRYPHRNCTGFQKWPLDTRYHGTLERSRVKETWKCYLSPSGECRPLASHRQSQRLDCHHGSYSSQAFKVANSFSLPRLISSPPLHPRGLPLVISLFWALKCSNWLCMTLSFQFSVLSRQGLSCMQ